MKRNLFKKNIYLFFFTLLTFSGMAQQKMFTGTVIDRSGKPVENALITIKEQPGMKIFTDHEGKFAVSGETGQIIEVTTRDQRYKKQKIENSPVVLTLTENDGLIPTGYGMEQRKDGLTSAIGIVKANELAKSSVWNPASALYGKIPGLTVLQNGGTNWDSEPTLYIRGVETFAIGSVVNTGILTLIDGFERPLSSLSLGEIESIAILKDAAALARYGMRGANGVLLVTTKRGSGKSLSVDVSYERGAIFAFRLPDFLDSYNYAKSVNQARLNDGLATLYSQPELERFRSGSSPYLYPNVNWQEESLRDFGTSDRINVSFQQQTGVVRYFSTLNFQNEEGLFGSVNENEGYSTQALSRKFNFRSNIDIDITKSTLFTVRLAGNIKQNNSPRSTEDAIFSAINNTPSSAYPVRTYHNEFGGTSNYNNNPVALISAQGYATPGKHEIMTDFILEQKLDKIAKGLSVEAGVSYDASLEFLDQKTKQFRYEQLTPVLDPVTNEVTDTIETLYGSNTSLAFGTSTRSQWRRQTILANLKYEKEWGDNELQSFLLFQQEELVRNGQNNTYRHLLGTGNVHYGKAGKYFADLTLSANGTNVLPKDSRVGFFPAVSLAWKLSDEKWFAESKVFDDLKLRASWGMSGNDMLIQNIYMSPWAGGAGYYFGAGNNAVGGYAEGRLASSPLTYETSYKSNIGLDASLFKALDLNVDVFYDKRKGILASTSGTMSAVIGVYNPYSSVGVVENKGMELGLNFHKSSGGFNYYVNGQLSVTKNKVIDMLEVYRPEEYLKRTGRSIGQSFGLEAIGFFKDEAEIAASPKQTFSIVRPGDAKYKDQNNDGIINAFDEVPIGYSGTVPEIYFSGSFGVEYKGIGIDACFQGVANQNVYLYTSSIFWPLVNNTNISTFSAGAWTPETATTATLPRLTTLSNDNNYRANTIWLKDGSFLKLRSAEIYYNLPKQVLSKVKLERAKLYIRGMNLFSIDNIKIVDPEATGNGYPTTASCNLGIQIGF